MTLLERIQAARKEIAEREVNRPADQEVWIAIERLKALGHPCMK